jgi:hypothetical protein
MDIEQRLIVHNLNLDYQKEFNYERQTSKTLNIIMNNFIHDYKEKFDTHTFLLEYNDDICSIISYYILKNIQGIYDFNLKVFGRIKNTKKLFYNNKDIIKKRKLKYIDNIIKINSFNPLYYVDFTEKDFNDLSNSISLINRFTIKQLKYICKFFNLNTIQNKKIIYPLLDKDSLFLHTLYNCLRFTNNKIIKDKYCIKVKKFKVYELTGTEEDFPIFDSILEDEQDSLCFYYCPKEKEEFIKNNLNHFINSRNAAISGYNLNIPKDELNNLKKEWEGFL